ncbi:MAG: Ubiquinone biosynthesis O-methyltransferase [Phycisphaerae bacterium]|nr:Ubiquinone biosynthesis O-methyltransferase [Phycisphaerae bacterium]
MTPTQLVAPVTVTTGPAIWDRVWRHAPDVEKDEARLAREARGRRWAETVRFLNAALGGLRGLRTIELGSGLGDLSVLLAREGADVTLVDYCDKALTLARQRFDRLGLRATFQRADFLGDLSEQAGRYDVALSVGVVEHFRGAARTAALAAHRAVLRAGGAVVISVPHALCPTYRIWKAYLQFRGWWPYGLEIPYLRRELSRRARHAGFEQVRCQAFGFRESWSEHVLRGLLRRGVGVDDRPSRLDATFGLVLMMTGIAGGRLCIRDCPDAS